MRRRPQEPCRQKVVRAAVTRRRRKASPAEPAREGDQVGVRVGVSQLCGIVTAEPVAEGGARDVGVLGILSLGLWIRRAEVVVSLGNLGSGPAGRVCAWLGGLATVRGGHGSCSLRGVVVNLP